MKNNIYSRRLGQGDNCSLYFCSARDGIDIYIYSQQQQLVNAAISLGEQNFIYN